MKSLYNYIVKPIGERYNNTKKIGNKNLIINTEIFNHQYVNRESNIISIPLHNTLSLQQGSKVLIHHNVFRRWHNVKGVEKNSRGYLNENEYLVSPDQIFAYYDNKWKAIKGYTFVKHIASNLVYEKEKDLIGIVNYSTVFNSDEVVGFTPNSKYEFIINGERLYRVMDQFITINYGHKTNEKEYNPSWA